MPGHNHYAWCTCGWCLKHTRRQHAISTAIADAHYYSAQALLRRHNALRSVAACFVNPNAKCPVCRATVFYYQNEYGSRVFFDELGPPWPKHPCTSSAGIPAPSTRGSAVRPAKRARGEAMELLEAARQVWNYESVQPGSEESDGWTLIAITDVSRVDKTNTVAADVLGAEEKTRIRFCFDSATSVLQAGDIASLQESRISIFNIHRMKPAIYDISIIEISNDH